MEVTTKSSTQTWQSPDGKRTIWEVMLATPDGSDYKLKTYSEAIAKVGFTGEVKTYLNERGDRFARQVSEGNGSYGGGRGNNEARAKQDADKQSDIKAEWAIGQAIKATGQFPLDAAALEKVESLASELYAMVGRVKQAD